MKFRLEGSWIDHSRVDLQMSYMTCNGLAITGYSICYHRSILTLHAHHDGEDMSFYKDWDKAYWIPDISPIWIYTPMNSGETMSKIWGRCDRDSMGIGLIVRMVSPTNTHISNT